MTPRDPGSPAATHSALGVLERAHDLDRADVLRRRSALATTLLVPAGLLAITVGVLEGCFLFALLLWLVEQGFAVFVSRDFFQLLFAAAVTGPLALPAYVLHRWRRKLAVQIRALTDG